MKKFISILSVFVSVFLAVSLTGCENFISSSEAVKEALVEEVRLDNAKTLNVTVQALPGTGNASHSFINTKDYKLGYPFNVSFEPVQGYGYYNGWKAYSDFDAAKPVSEWTEITDSKEVKFETPLGLSTVVTISKDYSSIRILPYVSEFPEVMFPNVDGITDKEFTTVQKGSAYGLYFKTTGTHGFSTWKMSRRESNSSEAVEIPVYDKTSTIPGDVTEYAYVTSYSSADSGDLAENLIMANAAFLITGNNVVTDENGVARVSANLMIQKQINDSVFIEPVLSEYPYVSVAMPEDFSEAGKISVNPYTSSRMIVGRDYTVSLTTVNKYGFSDWKIIAKASGDADSNASDFDLPFCNINDTSSERPENYGVAADLDVLEVDENGNYKNAVIRDAAIVIYDTETTSSSSDIGSVKVTAKVRVMKNTGLKFYLEPVLTEYPFVSVAMPSELVNPGKISVTPASNNRMIVGKDYSLNMTTANAYGFKDWKITMKSTVTDEESGAVSSITSALPFVKIDSTETELPAVYGVITTLPVLEGDGYGSYTNPVINGATIVIYDTERSNSSSDAGSIKATALVRVLKDPGAELYIEPVLITHPTIRIQVPVYRDTKTSRDRDAGTINPQGSTKIISDQVYSVNTVFDDKYAFDSWVVKDTKDQEILLTEDADGKKTFGGLFELTDDVYVKSDMSESTITLKVCDNANVNGFKITAKAKLRPAVSYSLPSANASGVIRTYPIRIYFSQNMDPASFAVSGTGVEGDPYVYGTTDQSGILTSLKNITITRADSPADTTAETNNALKYFKTPVFHGNYIELLPYDAINASNWMKSQSFVTVTVSGDVKDVSGVPLGNDYVLNYTLGNKGDTEGPLITKNDFYIVKGNENPEKIASKKFSEWNDYKTNRTTSEKKIKVAGDVSENYNFKLVVDADDSSTGGSGVEKFIVEERLCYAAKGAFVSTSDNVYVMQNNDAVFFDETTQQNYVWKYYSSNGFVPGEQDFYSRKEYLISELSADEEGHFILGVNYDEKIASDGVHAFTLKAVDVLGHESDPVNYYVILDNEAPVPDTSKIIRDVSDIAKNISANGRIYVKDTAVTFKGSTEVKDSGNSDDNYPVTSDPSVSWAFALDTTASQELPEDAVWSEWKPSTDDVSITLPELTGDALINVWVKLKDSLGNESYAFQVPEASFGVDKTTPAKPVFLTIPNPPATNTFMNGDIETFIITAGGNLSAGYFANGDGELGSGINKFMLKKNDGDFEAKPVTLLNNSTKYEFTDLEAARYTLKAVDNVGNESEPLVFDLRIDDGYGPVILPNKTVKDTDCNAANITVHGKVTYQFTVQDSGAGLKDIQFGSLKVTEYQINDEPPVVFETPLDNAEKISISSMGAQDALTFVVKGELTNFQEINGKEYNIAVRAYDMLGNGSPIADGRISLTVAANPPEVSFISAKQADISSAVNGYSKDGNIELLFTVNDESGNGLNAENEGITFEKFTVSSYRIGNADPVPVSDLAYIPLSELPCSNTAYTVKGKATDTTTVPGRYNFKINVKQASTGLESYIEPVVYVDSTAPELYSTPTLYIDNGPDFIKPYVTNIEDGKGKETVTFVIKNDNGAGIGPIENGYGKVQFNPFIFEGDGLSGFNPGSVEDWAIWYLPQDNTVVYDIPGELTDASTNSGYYTVKFKIKDVLGNESAVQEAKFEVDATAPTVDTVSIYARDVTKYAGTIVSGAVDVYMNITETGSGIERIKLDPRVVSSCEIYQDTGSGFDGPSLGNGYPFVTPLSSDETISLKLKISLRDLSSGKLQYQIFDKAGNSTGSLEIPFNIDRTAPQVSGFSIADQNPAAVYNTEDVVLSLSVTEDTGLKANPFRFDGFTPSEISVNGADFIPFSSLNVSGFTESTSFRIKGKATDSSTNSGYFTVKCYVSDVFGNEGYVTGTLEYDNVAPSITSPRVQGTYVVSGGSHYVNSTEVLVTFILTETGSRIKANSLEVTGLRNARYFATANRSISPSSLKDTDFTAVSQFVPPTANYGKTATVIYMSVKGTLNNVSGGTNNISITLKDNMGNTSNPAAYSIVYDGSVSVAKQIAASKNFNSTLTNNVSFYSTDSSKYLYLGVKVTETGIGLGTNGISFTNFTVKGWCKGTTSVLPADSSFAAANDLTYIPVTAGTTTASSGDYYFAYGIPSGNLTTSGGENYYNIGVTVTDKLNNSTSLAVTDIRKYQELNVSGVSLKGSSSLRSGYVSDGTDLTLKFTVTGDSIGIVNQYIDLTGFTVTSATVKPAGTTSELTVNTYPTYLDAVSQAGKYLNTLPYGEYTVKGSLKKNSGEDYTDGGSYSVGIMIKDKMGKRPTFTYDYVLDTTAPASSSTFYSKKIYDLGLATSTNAGYLSSTREAVLYISFMNDTGSKLSSVSFSNFTIKGYKTSSTATSWTTASSIPITGGKVSGLYVYGTVTNTSTGKISFTMTDGAGRTATVDKTFTYDTTAITIPTASNTSRSNVRYIYKFARGTEPDLYGKNLVEGFKTVGGFTVLDKTDNSTLYSSQVGIVPVGSDSSQTIRKNSDAFTVTPLATKPTDFGGYIAVRGTGGNLYGNFDYLCGSTYRKTSGDTFTLYPAISTNTSRLEAYAIYVVDKAGNLSSPMFVNLFYYTN